MIVLIKFNLVSESEQYYTMGGGHIVEPINKLRNKPGDVQAGIIATLGSVLDTKQSWESGKFQLVSSVVSFAQFVSSCAELVSRKKTVGSK